MSDTDRDGGAPRAEIVRVTGRVQGVGYRYHASNAARELRLAGWVRNRLDDSVEIRVQGEPEALDRFVEALRSGPPLARVAGIERTAIEVDPTMVGFRIRT